MYLITDKYSTKSGYGQKKMQILLHLCGVGSWGLEVGALGVGALGVGAFYEWHHPAREGTIR